MLVDNFMVGAGFVLPADEQERKEVSMREAFRSSFENELYQIPADPPY
ncbi:MAG TPA: hypothetical protein VGO51_17935 [Burkholderiaceae bacterium]|jgi:hypothetical protein|nr:hypothetical protein [Burkholderiaceae bacterium]